MGDDNYNDVEANSIRVTIDKGEANVTGDSVNVIYGNDITLTVNVALKASNGIMLASATENQVVFTFPKDGKTETRMVATGGGTVEIEIPAEQVKDYFNPGLNEVTVSYGGSGNLDTGNAKISVTVGKKPLDFKFKAEDRAYNGSNVVTGTLEMDTELVGNDNVTATPTATVASENASAKPVDVMVNVTLGGADAEYYNVGTVTGGTVTINKAIIGLVTTPALANLTYNGTEQVLLSDSASGVPEGATISYYVGADGGSTAPDGSESGWGELESIKAKDVGTYTVWYKIDGGTNYENVGPTEIGEATIGKKPVKLTWKGYDGLAYTGKPVNVTAEFADGEIVSSDKADVIVSVSGGHEIEANPGETYTATATLEGDRAGNYMLSNSTQTYTIQKAVPTVEVPILFGKYGDGYTVIAFVSVSGVDTSLVTGTVQFKSGSTTLGTAEVKNGTASLLIFGTDRDKQHVLFGTDGRSTVTAEYSGNNNIGTGGGGGFATVTPRTLKYDVTAAGRVYVPGNTAVAVTLAPKNLIGTDDVTLTAKGNLSSADAGTYDSVSLTEITMGGADAKYYAVSSTADNVTLTSPVTISQAKAIVETPPTGNDDLIYNGKLQSLLSVGGTSVGGTMQYTVGEKDSAEQPNETAEWKENIADITATNAGTYTIWYRANGDVDYATSDLGSITVTIGKATSTVTVQALTGTYGGDFTITAEVTASGVDASLVAGSVQFTAGSTPLGTANVVNGTATLTVPGTDRDKQHALFGTAGTSTVTAAYSGNDNINEETGSGTATIGLRTLKYDVTATDRAYEPGKTEVEISLIQTNLVQGDSVTLTAKGSLSSADAGTYESVSLTDIAMSGEDKGYYTVGTSADNVPLTTPVTISKIKAKVETPPTGKAGLTYNSEPQSLLSGGGTSVGGTMQYTVGGKNSTEQPDETADWKDVISDITAVEAGTYTIWYRAKEDIDYTTSDLGHIEVTIGKPTPTVTVQPVTGAYGEDITITAEVTVPDVDPTLVTGTVQFTDGDTPLGTADVVNGTATLTVPGTDRDKQHALFGTAGSSTVTAAYSGNDNISDGTGNGTATISPRTLAYDVTATGREYEPGNTEVEVSLIPTNLVAGDNVTLTAKGKLSSEDVGTYDSISLTRITIGGADAKYYEVSATADNVPLPSPVTISKAKAELKTPPTGNENLIYTGEPQSLLSAEGTSTGGTMQYCVGAKDSTDEPDETATWKKSITDITAAEAGTYTIWYRAKEDIDYTTSDLGSIKVTIGKATPTVTVQPVTGTYGEDITITAEVAVTGVDPSLVTGTIEFTDGDTTFGSADVQNGTATLKILGTDQDKQHTLFGTGGSSTISAVYGGTDNIEGSDASTSATIGKRVLKYTVTATDRAFEAGKTEVEVTLTPTNLIEGDSVTLTATGSLSSADAGTYDSVSLTDIKMSGEDKGYYTVETSADNVPLTTPVTIGKTKAKVETPPTGKMDLTYTGKPQSILSSGGTSAGGTMQYTVGEKDSIEQPNETAEWKSSISDITAVEAGTYTIWYRASGDGDYTTSDLGSITVTIGKATASVTVQAVSGTYGEDITITAEVTVPDVDPSLVTGTVQFAAGSITLGAANVQDGTATLKVPGTDRDKQHALFGSDGSSTVTAAYSGNGNISEGTANGTATVNQRALEYDVTAENKAFDGRSDIPVTLTPSNALSGDQVFLTAVGTVESPVAGEYSTINLTGITLSGEDARYYTVETDKADVELDAPITITGDNTGSPQGRVTMDGEPVPNASVTIKQGDEVVATTETDSNGYYYFEDTDPGVYEVIVETEDKTMTSMVEYTEETGTEKNLEVPVEDVNSVLNTEKAPESVVAVGGLDAAASDHAESGSTVTVTMTVESKTASDADHAQAIERASGGKELDYMSIELKKEVKTEEGTTEEPLTETTELLTIVLRFDFSGKDDVVVYRYHSDAVDTLTETENENGEHIVLDEASGTITIHAKNFSTYAIGYTLEAVPSDPPVSSDPPIPTEPPTPPCPPISSETPAPTEPPAATNPPIPVEPAPTYYDITISSESSDSEGGTVTANPKSAQEGSKVTLTVKTDEGYHFVSLTVTDSKGNPVELTDNKDGTYSFKQPAGKVSVEAAFVKCSSLAFTDLDPDAWYHDHIDYVLSHGLMQGIGDNRFAPDITVSRAQMVTVLWNLRGQPVVNFYMTYSDVTEGTWYAEAVRWATSEGIVSGYGNGAFGPNDPISREQMAAMIYHYEQKYGDGGFTGNWMYRLPFSDLDQISDWAFESVAWCNMNNVISGKEDNLFDPKGFAKRSEMAAILRKYLTQTE